MKSPAAQYLAASLSLGLISVWGSEMLFWSAPNGPLDAVDLLMTWLVYSLSSAAALSIVLLTGVRGLPALALGGFLLGWAVEGVIVGTAYDTFPLQLAWTPMAWHGLVTSIGLLGLWRAAATWPVAGQAAYLLGATLFGAFWAQYWPLEKSDLPGFPVLLVYLGGLGLALPLAHGALDRIGSIGAVSRPILWIAPAILLAVWLLQFAGAPDPRRLALLVMVGATVFVMWRLGSPGTPLALGPVSPSTRHLALLIPPTVIAYLASEGWARWHGLETNWSVAIVLTAGSIAIWLWLLVRAIRSRRPVRAPAPRSPATSG